MRPRTAWDKNPNEGEAGCKLEDIFFGGTMEYWVDPDTGTSFGLAR